ncbi:MAG TPA: hypothetical protein VF985_07045 [Mariniflexile sp.]
MKKILLITLLISSLKLEAQNTFPSIGSVTITKPQGAIVAYDGINSNNLTVTRMEVTHDSSGQMWLKDSNGDVKVYLKSNNAFPSSIVGELVIGEFAIASKSKEFYVNGNSQFTGNIGIGTNTIPTDFKLAVAGKIIAEELKVQLQTVWPDYVFASDYNLPDLSEVEKYIKQNGHLINVPTAKEIENEGLVLGEITKIQQEKIEELTLYAIDQQKQLDQQGEALKKQAQEIEELKALINTLVQKNK